MATRCCCPPDRVRGIFSLCSPRYTQSSNSLTLFLISFAGLFIPRRGKATLSNVERWLRSRKSWKTTPTRWRRSNNPSRLVVLTFLPNIVIVPDVGILRRHIRFIRDVLPDPLGPDRKWYDPRSRLKLTLRRIFSPSSLYLNPTFSNLITCCLYLISWLLAV